MLAKIELISIENNRMSKALTDRISHEYFTLVINEEEKYCKLKESIINDEKSKNSYRKKTNKTW